MKKLPGLAAFAFTLLSLSAVAGFVRPAPVLVQINEDLSGSAHGDMVTARFADNDVELIGCGSWTVRDPLEEKKEEQAKVIQPLVFGFCQAVDADGVQGACNTTDAAMVEQMRATADYSFIRFEWDKSGTCTLVRFSTQSFYIPEHTDKKSKNK